MNILFIGIRGNEDEITSAPKKISNSLYNRMTKEHENVYFFGLPWENDVVDISNNENEIIAPLSKLGSFIKDKKIDLVYFSRYYTKIALYLILIKPIYGFKLVYTVHGIIKKERIINKTFKFYSAIIEDKLLNLCDRIIVVSDGLKSELLKFYPKLNKDKIAVINNGVALSKIKKEVNIKNFFKLEGNKKILFTTGTRKIKNNDILIESFISDEELYKSAYLLIAGEADTDFAKQLIKKYSIYQNVKFLGQVSVDFINNIYEQMDLYIQISSFETFGIAIVEALLHKRKVLISKELPIAGYFSRDEVCLYDPGQDLLHDVILSCLKQRIDINEKGYNKAQQLFNWEIITDKYYKTFCEVL